MTNNYTWSSIISNMERLIGLRWNWERLATLHTNYGQDNHNVDMCRMKKKKKPTVVATQATT